VPQSSVNDLDVRQFAETASGPSTIVVPQLLHIPSYAIIS
jgi:hypothetical protein